MEVVLGTAAEEVTVAARPMEPQVVDMAEEVEAMMVTMKGGASVVRILKYIVLIHLLMLDNKLEAFSLSLFLKCCAV